MQTKVQANKRALLGALIGGLVLGPAVALRAQEAAAPAAAADPVSGSWSITITSPMLPGPQTGTLTLSLSGTQVSGTAVASDDGTAVSLSGTWGGGKLALDFDDPSGGMPGTLTATITGDTLSGSIAAGPIVLQVTGTRAGGAAAATVGTASVAALDTAAQAQQRLQRLMQARLDRRPSTILRTWVTPVEEPDQDPSAAPPPAVMPGGGGDEGGVIVMEEGGIVIEDEGLPPEIQAQMMAAMAQAQGGAPAAAPGAPADPFQAEVKAWERAVTLGDWAYVASTIASLPPELGKQLHTHLLQGLSVPPPDQRPQHPAGMALMEKNALGPPDVIALSDAAPVATDATTLALLGGLLHEVESQGHVLDPVLAAWKSGDHALGGGDPARRRAAAEVLLASGRAKLAGTFVPDRAAAEGQNDAKGLDLLARWLLALNLQEEKKLAHLEAAWQVNLRLLGVPALPEPAPATGPEDEAAQAARSKQKREARELRELKRVALERAVALVPRVRDELGQTWLLEGFERELERGRDVLALTGALAASGRMLHPREPQERLQALRLQHVAAKALIEHEQARAAEWGDKLELLLRNWLAEAEVSLAEGELARQLAQLRRDRYGNFYYFDDMEMMQQRQDPRRPQPIGGADLLDLRPGEEWLACTPESLRPRVLATTARLHLLQREPDRAFPLLERMAAARPEEAHALAEELLRIWTEEHDLNTDQSRRGQYVFFWGFEQRADGIPLTRSKQERNLAELGRIVARLRQLPIQPVSEKLLANAFVRCHGSAEVYRLEAVEKVFGAVSGLEAPTLAGLIQTMRANLAQHWRDPEVQRAANTKRKKAEVEAEVVRGYEVALRLAEDGLQRHVDRWELLLARAAVLQDQNEYVRRELRQSAEYSSHRAAALEAFQAAARAYAARLPQLEEKDESLDVYETWFHAALGACDANRLKNDQRPDMSQPLLIRAALEALPGEAAARHLKQFASGLFTRLSAVDPGVKFTYLKAGFMIVGDHPDAREARKVFDYYRDLVTEIELITRVDGSDRIGHQRAFGLFVDIRHTEHIERESGGFQKYLQNQNQGYFAWNYGRPTEDYRDKFEEAARKALGERFEVLSVTFHEPSVRSREDAESGWRVTPYAYLLLRPKGPEVDKVPSLELHLDFLDTTGYVVLPVASAPLPVDARDPKGDPRPFSDLELTETLDERRAGEGLLVYEIKATARGLVPDLDQVLGPIPAGFRVEKTDDQGCAVVRCDADKPVTAAVSERLWTLSLRGRTDQSALPAAFHFPSPKVSGVKETLQRYVDQDLVQVGREVPLEARYGDTAPRWPWALCALVLVGVAVAAMRIVSQDPAVLLAASPWQVPERVTPFTVQALLTRIRAEAPLSPEARRELDAALIDLDARYFARTPRAGEGQDLAALAREWVERAAPRAAVTTAHNGH